VAVTLGWDSYTVTVAANSEEELDKQFAAFAELLPDIPPPKPEPLPDSVVPVSFWMQDTMSGGAYSRRRHITIHHWDEHTDEAFGIHDPGVRDNYPLELAAQLDDIMAWDEPQGGKLMLFHGPPGTGKTRALLTLISEWRSWAHASVVTDADKFFGDATYLNSIVFESEGLRDWLLLVIEDGDEFLNVDEKSSKGQSIARLLNVGDGIVGQGLKLFTIITTNVDTEKLNPAITRPGRCAAQLHFGQFQPEEATAWAAGHGSEHVFDEPATLAEMYQALS
jgi:hypothetical protein